MMRPKLLTSDIAVIVLLCYYVVKWVVPFSLPLLGPTSYKGMAAITIVENLQDPGVDQLLTLQAMDEATAARGMTRRAYDEDQPAALELLKLTDVPTPNLLIWDGKDVVAAWPLPSRDELPNLLGPIPNE